MGQDLVHSLNLRSIVKILRYLLYALPNHSRLDDIFGPHRLTRHDCCTTLRSTTKGIVSQLSRDLRA